MRRLTRACNRRPKAGATDANVREHGQMAIDALIEVAARAILEVVFVGVFYWPGWAILRLLTLGRYPPAQTIPHNRYFVAMIALAVVLVGVTVYFSFIRP